MSTPKYSLETLYQPTSLGFVPGVLNQLSITIGIFATQAIGLPLAKKSQWRLVMVISSALALIHAAFSIFVHDTPAWLSAKGRQPEAVHVSRRLHGKRLDSTTLPTDSEQAVDDDRSSLLSRHERPASPPSQPSESLSITALLGRQDLLNAVFIVSFAMLAQQGSGINAGWVVSNSISSPYCALIW